MKITVCRIAVLTTLLIGFYLNAYCNGSNKDQSCDNSKKDFFAHDSASHTKKLSGYADKSLFYIETDPSALFFNGFTLQLRRSSLFKNKMVFGIGYYRADLPDFWINANSQNKDKDWSARVRNGIDLIVDYHLFHANKSLFTGLGLSFYQFDINRLGLKSGFTSFVPSLRVGYLWRPFNKCFYIVPIAALAYNTKISGSNTIAGESLVIKKWAFVPTVNIGFSF